MQAWFELHPQLATEKGYPGLDARPPSFSQSEVDTFLRALNELFGDDTLDGRLLEVHKRAAVFSYKRLGVLQKNPVFYLKAGLDSLECLELRYEQLPWKAVESRLLGLRPLLEQARAQLTEPQEPAIEVALEMAQVAIDHFGSAFKRDRAPEPVARAADQARGQVDDFACWLTDCQQAPFQPMGEELFREMLSCEHLLDDQLERWSVLAYETIEKAECLLDDAQPAQMNVPELRDRDSVFEFYREELETVRAFVERTELVTVPEGPLLLVQTPDYLEPLVPGAFYLEPALFSGDRTGRFYVPRVGEPFDDEMRAYYQRRLQRGGFRNLVVHEAWPGHHLQFLHAGLHFNPMRNLRDNDVMLEGWALYCEELMESAGLYGATPFLPRLNAARMRALRVLVDMGLHTGRLDIASAVDFMAGYLGEGARGWLNSEVRRYALEPTQAMSYLVGAHLIAELRQELEVPHHRLREFHDLFLSYGPIPIPLIRRDLLTRWKST